MSTTTVRFRKKFLVGIGILAAGVLAGYTYFQARTYLAGPQITVLEPRNGATVAEERVSVIGIAKNIAHLTLNDRQIFTDDRGMFSERLLLPRGYSIMKLTARDRFDREKTIFLEIVYRPNDTRWAEATSTPVQREGTKN